MSDHDLAESMELEPEYASLIVPNMVIIRNFIEIFQAEALWIRVFLFWTGLPMTMRKKTNI